MLGFATITMSIEPIILSKIKISDISACYEAYTSSPIHISSAGVRFPWYLLNLPSPRVTSLHQKQSDSNLRHAAVASNFPSTALGIKSYHHQILQHDRGMGMQYARSVSRTVYG